MGLLACSDCGGKVSDRAPACPHCGAPLTDAKEWKPPEKTQRAAEEAKAAKQKKSDRGKGCLTFVIACFVALIIVGALMDDVGSGAGSSAGQRTSKSEPAKVKSPEETRRELVESAFSGWDGSHRELVKYVKGVMNDPGSFEHVETRFGDQGDHVLVIMTFRGKNGFGGVITQKAVAKTRPGGGVIELIGIE